MLMHVLVVKCELYAGNMTYLLAMVYVSFLVYNLLYTILLNFISVTAICK